MLSGEIITFLETIEFQSKSDLLEKLRTMRSNTVCLSKKDRHIVKAIIGVAIQQVFHTKESRLLKFSASKKERNEKAN